MITSSIEVVIEKQIACSASRSDVVSYVQDVASAIRNIPLSQLTEARNLNNPEARYPETLGERIANSVTYVLATQDWLEDDSDDILSEIFDVMTQLDISVSSADDWKSFFELTERLS